jgi:hypothetical protein
LNLGHPVKRIQRVGLGGPARIGRRLHVAQVTAQTVFECFVLS